VTPSAVRRLLVIAPHPDDEVLGCGGTMARLADAGTQVHVAIVTRGTPPLYSESDHARDCEHARAAHSILGVSETHFLRFPAARLDTVPHGEVNAALARLLAEIAPDTLLLPFGGDIHIDHQLTFASSLVAARPNRPSYPARLYAYETLSETNWNAPYLAPSFVPTLFVDIAATLQRKLDAMRAFASQLRSFPNERSIEALEALARLRGATVHRAAAEAFVVVREVI